MPSPVFVVGSSRSGTTLLAAMLNAHPRLACGPEAQILNKISPKKIALALQDSAWPERATGYLSEIEIAEQKVIDAFGLSTEEVRNFLRGREPGVAALFEAICGQYAARQCKPRWVEKTPRHLLHLPTIRKAFPDARIIRMVRDPRDSALSMRQLPWASDTYLANLYLWCQWYEDSDDFFETDAGALTVFYERLASNPRAELEKICAFIGEDFDEGMLRHEQFDRELSTANEIWKKQVFGPLDASRVFRWKSELSDVEKRMSAVICEKWLKKFGYEAGDTRAERRPAYGLTRAAIEANLDWLYRSAQVGRIYLPSADPWQCPALTLFLADDDIAGRQAFLSILKMLWYRRRRGRPSDLRFFPPRSRFPRRRLLLRLLADIA